MPPSFEWDDDKASSNERKHGVSFPEAVTVFGNPLAAIFDDPDHSGDEHREILVGDSELGRLVIVSFHESAGVIRIIGARPATPRERRDYQENPFGGWGHA
jgi:uncharacterized DUF497 family protein